jgi:hypothetical protein
MRLLTLGIALLLVACIPARRAPRSPDPPAPVGNPAEDDWKSPRGAR